jgi:ABC-type multidrug transport system ATPase subunit
MPTDADAVLVARGASKSYADLVALAPLDLLVEDGERVALVGHNGSGKSTFLQLTAGLLELSEGTIDVVGATVGASDARAAISYLPDTPVLYDDLSVREHLAYVAALHGVDADEEEIDELIDRVGLTDRADDLPARFSRGLRQKASIAVGLVRPFQLLLVDEPFVGLDAAGKEALVSLLDEAHDSGAASIVATHDPEYVERVDRCVALRDGEVIHDGPATQAEVLRLVAAG